MRRGGQVRSAARAPAVARRVIFVYDNNNGTHRIAKRTRWVVLMRRRRADLSDRGRGRRVAGRTISQGGEGRRRREMLASRAAESVEVSARRFTSEAKKTTIIVFFGREVVIRGA